MSDQPPNRKLVGHLVEASSHADCSGSVSDRASSVSPYLFTRDSP